MISGFTVDLEEAAGAIYQMEKTDLQNFPRPVPHKPIFQLNAFLPSGMYVPAMA